MVETSAKLKLFCLITSKFGVWTEETSDELPHIEQHGTQSCTVGDAIDIAEASHRTTESEVNEQGQEKHKRDGG